MHRPRFNRIVFVSWFAVAASACHQEMGNASFIPTNIDLAIVSVNTAENVPIVSKDVYVDAQVNISPAASAQNIGVYDAAIQIKGHGNSTWSMPKKPYKIKLPSNAALLGMEPGTDWILLANYDDKTLMRNAIAFELSRRLGMAWTPRSVFVEMFLNGLYQGNYQLTEEVEVDPNRVNIDELKSKDTDANVITGGYLIEGDQTQSEDTWFETAQGVYFGLIDPDPIPAAQLTYIQNYVLATENAIYSDNFTDPTLGYANYLDLDSLIDWYLINELTKNTDAAWVNSDYLYKPRGQKLFTGPIWDMDITCGNVNYNDNSDPTGWYLRNQPWFSRLFTDPAFVALVRSKWQSVKASQLDTMGAYIDQTAAALNLSQQNNFQRWTILNSWVWPNSEVAGSYDNEVTFVKSWLTTRIAWIDANL